MTNEEARQWFLKVYSEIKGRGYVDENEEAYELAIKALEQKPCDTCKHNAEEWDGEHCDSCCGNHSGYEPCENAVSRQAVLKEIADYVADGWAESPSDINAISALVNELPSVQPKAKTGHWIYTEYHTWCCSECGGNPHKGTGFVPNKDGMKMRWKYCNLCGAEMKGGGE